MMTRDEQVCGIRGLVRVGCGAVVLAAVVLSSGCSSTTLTITQGEYINTAMHMNRPAASRTGEPLELTVVCLYSKDLKHEANGRLAPGSGITSDIWYRDRPMLGDREEMQDRGTRFWVPKSQVFVMTYDKQYYGTSIGAPIRGYATDKSAEIRRRFDFPSSFKKSRAWIYVFPRFIDTEGRVLPVPPAVFKPGNAIQVEIGVNEDRAHYGQYITAVAGA